MRLAITLAAALAVTACVTPENKRVAADFQAPTERTRVVIMRPDVHMSLLTAGGLEEPRADWTTQAETNILGAFGEVLRNRGHDVVAFDPNVGEAGLQDQLILLHEAVGASILVYVPSAQLAVPTVVPTKAETFDWTLGEGAVALGQAYDADFALFTTTYGSYASGGRVAAVTATAVTSALFGVAIVGNLGARWTQASLVDLRTGDIVWMNIAANGDPREAAGAQEIADRVSADIPL
jgi:hypothetical protein